MTEPASLFRVQHFLSHLRDVGSAFGEPFHYFTTTASTNDEARALAVRGAPSGTTLLADHQTAGRGRLGRQWVAPPNQQLLVSLIWRPRAGSAPAALTLAVGVALHRALTAALPAGTQLALKWPNDLEVSGRKLGGVLVEGGNSEHGAHAVIGFGLNVHPVLPAPDVVMNPISLSELGAETPREELLVSLLRALAGELRQFERDGLRETVGYLNRHHALAGERVVVDDVEGTVIEVATNGSLVLDTGSGRREVSSGSVERRATR